MLTRTSFLAAFAGVAAANNSGSILSFVDPLIGTTNVSDYTTCCSRVPFTDKSIYRAAMSFPERLYHSVWRRLWQTSMSRTRADFRPATSLAISPDSRTCTTVGQEV